MSDWQDIVVSSYVIKKGTDVMASQYVSYTVQASCDGRSHAVERRFSEFVMLQKEIANEYPGAIIAPLPKDQVFGRFKPAFIESRMRGLEEFLRKTIAHPDLSKSACWSPFFSSHSFNEMTLNEERSKLGTSTTERSWIDSLKSMAAPVISNPGIDTSEMDTKMKEISDFVSSHSKTIQEASKTVTAVSTRSAGSASSVRKFSEVCSGIGCNSTDEDDSFLHQVGLSLRDLSSNMEKYAEEQNIKVKEPMERCMRTFMSIKSSLQRQKALKKSYISAAAEKNIAEVSDNNDPGNLLKIQRVRKCEEALSLSQKEYQSASDALIINFQKVKDEMPYEIISIVDALAAIELASCRRMADVLADMHDDLWEDETQML